MRSTPPVWPSSRRRRLHPVQPFPSREWRTSQDRLTRVVSPFPLAALSWHAICSADGIIRKPGEEWWMVKDSKAYERGKEDGEGEGRAAMGYYLDLHETNRVGCHVVLFGHRRERGITHRTPILHGGPETNAGENAAGHNRYCGGCGARCIGGGLSQAAESGNTGGWIIR